MSKVLLLNGSPHPHGCTATALEEMVNTFPHCDVGRHYISDQLHHYVFTVSYK